MATIRWQPIETAPKDRHLLVRDSDGHWYEAWWTNDAYAESGGRGGPPGWFSSRSGGDYVTLHEPVYWIDPEAIEP